jgi:hypothetical protein
VLYKAAHVSYSTTAAHVVKELIDKYAVNEEDKDPAMFCLVAAGDDADGVQLLDDKERPLVVQADWPNDSYCFRLCRRPDYQRSANSKINQYSGDMTVTIATPFPGKNSHLKMDFDDEMTSQLMTEQTLLEYDASLDPDLFGLYETWIEQPSRRKKARQLLASELIISVMHRVASGRVDLQLRRKELPLYDKRDRSRRPSSDSSASGITYDGSGSVLTGDVSHVSSLSPDPDWLDSEWEQRYDDKSQKEYYFNKITRESSWINPCSLRQPNMDPDLPFGWERGYDNKSKKIYYINHLTKETTWKNPNKRLTDTHNQSSSQNRETDTISPDSGTFDVTQDDIDICHNSPTKDTTPINHDRNDFAQNSSKSDTTAAQSTHGSAPGVSDAHSRNGEKEQPVDSPLPSPAVDSDVPVFMWTPQFERRDNSSFDRLSSFNRSERSRRSARLRGFMLQSLNQGMAGMMQEIASEGRGGLWTPQENRRHFGHQRPEWRRSYSTTDTDRRESDSKVRLVLESLPTARTQLDTVKTADKETETTGNETSTAVAQPSTVRSVITRFEEEATAGKTVGSESRELAEQWPGNSHRKVVDPQAAKARAELKRLSRKMSPSRTNESDTTSTETTPMKASRENTPTARVTPNNHVNLVFSRNSSGQPSKKLEEYLETVNSLKSAQPSYKVELEDTDLVASSESVPQVVTISYLQTSGDQPFPDVSPITGTIYPSKVESSGSLPSSVPNSADTGQPVISSANKCIPETPSDSSVSPLATITVDPSGSVTARASSYGKLTAVTTTETTEVTTTTEVMEIAASPPKRTKTITTEKKTLATAKVIPDDVAGLRIDQQNEKLESSAEVTYSSEERNCVVRTSPEDGDDDTFLLRPGYSEKITEEKEAIRRHEQRIPTETGSGKSELEPGTNTTEVAEASTIIAGSEEDFSSTVSPADSQAGEEAGPRNKQQASKDGDTKDPSSGESEIKVDSVAGDFWSTKTGACVDEELDDETPFVSYSRRRAATTGWRSRLGKMYANNDDDEWIQKRRHRRSATWKSFDSRDAMNSDEKEREQIKDASNTVEAKYTSLSFKPEDVMARRRRFFELRSLSLQEDAISNRLHRKMTTPVSSDITTSKGYDANSSKQAESTKRQLKETEAPSNVLTSAELESNVASNSASGKIEDTSKSGDGSENELLLDIQFTQQQKQKEKGPSPSPREDSASQVNLLESSKTASDEKKHSPVLECDQAVGSSTSSQELLSSSKSPLTKSSDSTARNIPIAKKFFEDSSPSISDAERLSAARRVQRSRSFQLRSAWLASSRTPSQSKKDTAVKPKDETRHLYSEERPTRNPPSTKSSPQSRNRSPRSENASKSVYTGLCIV